MPRDITEKKHDEAVRVLRAEYYQAVRSLVDEAMSEMKSGDITDREGLDEYIHQSVDGSYWVIYTRANMQVLFVSDNDDAYMDDFGEAPVDGGNINWAALAFAAMRRDVQDLLDAYDDEIETLLSGDLEESRRRRPRPTERGAGCSVTISSDPRTLGPDATAKDVERYAANLRADLMRRFKRHVDVRIGNVADTKANCEDVLEYIQHLERGDGWISLTEEAPRPRPTQKRRPKPKAKATRKKASRRRK